MSSLRWPLALLAFAPFAACSLDAGSFAGKTCDTQADCPSPYVCAWVRPGGSTCELVHGVDDSVGDGGSGGGGGGITIDWCHDVKPIVLTNCTSNCHVPPYAYPGAPTTFRLDAYQVDGGQGAYDMHLRMAARMMTDDMPPIGVSPHPNLTDRTTVINWAMGGAPECLATDGGP